jgi:D-aspartate ligase
VTISGGQIPKPAFPSSTHFVIKNIQQDSSRPTGQARAVVLGGSMNALGAVRSLGTRGVPVLVVAPSAEDPVLRSHYVENRIVACTLDREEELLDELLRVGRPGDVLIPTSDYFVAFLGRNRARLESKFLCCIPSDDLIEVLIDKAEETRCMDRLSVSMPKTLQTIPSCPESIVASLPLPIILKPRTPGLAEKLATKTVPIFDEAGLRGWYARQANYLSCFIAQELIPGGDGTQWECICVFDRDHQLRSCFTFRKIRTAPPGFGVTSFARSEWNPELAGIVARIGRELGYSGPADFDFKYDNRDGIYKYLETNPRLGMCNYFGAQCGVNCAYDSFLNAQGELVDAPLRRQQDGVMFLSAFDDLYGRAGGKRRSVRSLSSAIGEYVGLRFKRVSYAYFDPSDIAPWRWATRRDFRNLLTSARRKFAGGSQLRDPEGTECRMHASAERNSAGEWSVFNREAD